LEKRGTSFSSQLRKRRGGRGGGSNLLTFKERERAPLKTHPVLQERGGKGGRGETLTLAKGRGGKSVSKTSAPFSGKKGEREPFNC